MIKTIEKYIDAQRLLSPKSTVVVGLSGGADSMALLDVLTLLNYRCIAAHCNFHLRGEESDQDALFVKKWCKESDVEFTGIDFDTKQYASDKKISIEMAARELRYRWFEIVRKQYEAQAIAVAHHRDDSIETVLLNLIRGTGIRGLTGIPPKNGRVVRPMLAVSRTEILDYLNERELSYRQDSTNSQEIYLRNSVRMSVLPLLETLNPSAREAIFRTSRHLSEACKIYDLYISEATNRIFNGDRIDIPRLKQAASPSSVLFEILSPLGFTPSVIENIAESLEASPGKQFFSEKTRLIKDRDCFILSEIKEGNENHQFSIFEGQGEMSYPVQMNFKTMPNDGAINKTSDFLYADAEKLSFPLILRRWRPGDWFVPFGMKGKKKLSDYFTDRKFSLDDKERTWVLTSGNEVVWIVGERPDDRFKVKTNTKQVFVAHLVEKM